MLSRVFKEDSLDFFTGLNYFKKLVLRRLYTDFTDHSNGESCPLISLLQK